MQEPRLPLELEHKIFLLTLKEDVNEFRALILFAKRVYEWIMPEAFKVVIITHKIKFPFVFHLAKFRQYGRHIRSLLLTDVGLGFSANKIMYALYLSQCPNLTHLTLWASSYTFRVTLAKPTPQLLQVFANITHLLTTQIPNPLMLSLYETSSFRSLFPGLTHLGVSKDSNAKILREAVTDWNTLQVVLIWYRDGDGDVVEEVDVSVEDVWSRSVHPSLVRIRCRVGVAWKENEQGCGPHIWDVAERVVKARHTST